MRTALVLTFTVLAACGGGAGASLVTPGPEGDPSPAVHPDPVVPPAGAPMTPAPPLTPSESALHDIVLDVDTQPLGSPVKLQQIVVTTKPTSFLGSTYTCRTQVFIQQAGCTIAPCGIALVDDRPHNANEACADAPAQ